MTTPSLSIVIASFSSEAHLRRCLASLPLLNDGDEVIVSTCLAREQLQQLQQDFNARFIFHPREQQLASARLRETRVFRLRSSGVAAASGDWVALLEDHCELAPGWLAAVRPALADGLCIAGGPLDNGSTHGLFHWALYWSEYAALMPPLPASVGYLSAVNAVYHRRSLEACESVWAGGFYDNEVNDALISRGAGYCPLADALVRTRLPFSFGQTLVHLFTGGQRYGGYRGGSDWNATRLLRLLQTPLIPLVLFARVLRLLRDRQPRRLPTLLLASPLLLLLLGAWAAGELVGTAVGRERAAAE